MYLMKNITLYFTIFGLLLGTFNMIDMHLGLTRGNDVPLSFIINQPYWLVREKIVRPLISQSETIRKIQFEKQAGFSSPPKSLSKVEFEQLSSDEQKEYIRKMTEVKILYRNDYMNRKYGIFQLFISTLVSFPILSAISWGLIGFILHIIIKRRPKKKISCN